MSYQRKTTDAYILLTNYGYGWEEELEETSYKEIKQRAMEYLANTYAQIKILNAELKKEISHDKSIHGTREKIKGNRVYEKVEYL